MVRLLVDQKNTRCFTWCFHDYVDLVFFDMIKMEFVVMNPPLDHAPLPRAFTSIVPVSRDELVVSSGMVASGESILV
jgi:hypothetical protein